METGEDARPQGTCQATDGQAGAHLVSLHMALNKPSPARSSSLLLSYSSGSSLTLESPMPSHRPLSPGVVATWNTHSKKCTDDDPTPIFSSFSTSRERFSKQLSACLFLNGYSK